METFNPIMERLLKYKLWLSLLLIIIIAFVGYVLVYATTEKEVPMESPIEKIIVKEDKVIEPVSIYVDIKGAVKTPGVYQMKETDRIIDVINQSGGLTTEADTSITNLAYQITDGLSFKIYTKLEVKKLLASAKKEVITEDLICPSTTNSTCITSNISSTVPKPNPDTKTNTSLISINTATSETLQTLSGIGPATATKIINYRIDNGNFTTIEDIKNVSGIGDSIFAKIKDFITI